MLDSLVLASAALARSARLVGEGGIQTILVSLVRRFVDDCAVLEAAQVEHPHTPVCTTAHENIHALCTEAHIEDFLVVGDELRLGSEGGDVPDGTGGVDARRDDETRGDDVPV